MLVKFQILVIIRLTETLGTGGGCNAPNPQKFLKTIIIEGLKDRYWTIFK